jgi:hypothetical protein
MVDLSWPEGHSDYAALVGRDGKKAWRERVVSQGSVGGAGIFPPPGRGLFYNVCEEA